MERKSNSLRDTLSLLLSVCLHGSAVAIIVLGPSYFPGMNGMGSNSGKNSTEESAENSAVELVEFTVPESTPAATTAAETQTNTSAAVTAPVATEVVKSKPAPIVAAQPKTQSNKLPEKVVQEPAITPQTPTPEPTPAVATEPTPELVDNSDVALAAPAPQEEIKSTDVATSENVTNEKTEVVQEEEIVAAQEPVKEEVPAEEQEKVEDKMLTPPPIAPVAEETKAVETTPVAEATPVAPAPTTTPEPVTNPTNAPTAAGSSTTGATTAAAAEGSSIIKTQRSYLTLKQMSGNTPPVYTREMRFQKLEGRGELVCFVNKDGRVTNMRVKKSTGKAELDNAALQAFSKYKFEPNQEGYTSFPFEFTLKGPAVSDTGRLRTTMSR